MAEAYSIPGKKKTTRENLVVLEIPERPEPPRTAASN
jgi:hypothetical protein